MINIDFDKTYCASPNCQNKCGRRLSFTLSQQKEWDEFNSKSAFWIQNASFAQFCDENGEVIENDH